MDKNFQVALDVGSSKVCAVISRRRGEGVDILGHGVAPCAGVVRGVVEDLDAASAAIREAVGRAERSAELRASAVYASLSQRSALGSIASVARTIAAREALVVCAERAGLRVIDVVPSALASAASMLQAPERLRGTAVLDVGAGVTDVVVYEDGAVIRSDTIDFGASELTAEIATRFGLALAEAEFLKRNVGCAKPEYLDRDDLVAVPNCANGAGIAISRWHLARVIEAKLAALWRGARRILGDAALPGGIAVSGGGVLLDGFPELAEAHLARRVWRAAPRGQRGLPGELQSPTFATAVGVACCVATQAGDLTPRPRSIGQRKHAIA